jgi:hypothetical protein
MGENLSEVEFIDSGNEIGSKQEFSFKIGTQTVKKMTGSQPVAIGWLDVKWQVKIWLLLCLHWLDVHTRYN